LPSRIQLNAYVFYDTNNDGTTDLILSDTDADGFADGRWKQIDNDWSRETVSMSNALLFDPQYFDEEVRKRVAKQFSTCVAALSKLSP
jgi:hypothetical protein